MNQVDARSSRLTCSHTAELELRLISLLHPDGIQCLQAQLASVSPVLHQSTSPSCSTASGLHDVVMGADDVRLCRFQAACGVLMPMVHFFAFIINAHSI